MIYRMLEVEEGVRKMLEVREEVRRRLRKEV